MKKTATLIVSAFILSMFVLGTSCKKEGSQVAIDIEGDKITVDEFNRYYYLQNRLLTNMSKKEIDKLADDPSLEGHPTLNKKRFSENLISQRLLLKKAKEDDKINKDELEAVLEIGKLQAAANYYIMEKFKNEIKVTDAEVEQFYKENPQIFKGVPINDEVISKIKQQIFMQKMQVQSNQMILDIMGETKIKKEGLRKYILNKKSAKTADKEDEKESPKKDK